MEDHVLLRFIFEIPSHEKKVQEMLLRVKILKINEFDVAQQQSLDQTTIQNIVI
jgi:hypothetical protein